jgi:hypothetical protein
MPVQKGEVSVVDAVYRIVVKEDVVLKHNYPGIFNRGRLHHGVYIKHFSLKDYYAERQCALLRREYRGKITAKIVDWVERMDRV